MTRLDALLGNRWLRRGLLLCTVLLGTLACTGLLLRWQLAALLAVDGGRLKQIEAVLPGTQIRATAAAFGIRWLVPYVRVEGLDLRTVEGMRFRAAVAAVELDTVESVLRLTPVLGRMQLDDAELTLRQLADGHWSVPQSRKPAPWSSADTQRLSDLLWESDRIAVSRFTALLYPRAQAPLKLVASAQLSNERGDHRALVRLQCGGVCSGALDYSLDGNPLFGVRNGGMSLSLRGLPRLRGVLRMDDTWVDMLDNRARIQVGVSRGVSVISGNAQLGVQLRGAKGQLLVLGRTDIHGGGRDGYDLWLPNLQLRLNDRLFALPGFVLGRRDRAWFARLPDFRIESLIAPVAQSAALPEAVNSWLLALNPRALIHDLRLHSGQQFSYAASIIGLNLNAHRGSPEIGGADVDVAGHALGGRMQFLASRFQVGFPDLFDKSFAAVSIAGPIDFWYAHGLTLHSGVLSGDSGDMKISGRFALDRPNDPSLQAFTLLLEISDGKTEAIRRYLPNVLDVPLHRWLDAAIGKGDLQHALIALHSYAKPQPGRRSQVELALDVGNMSLQFQPEWPALTALDARVVISDQHVFGDIHRGRAGAIELGASKVAVLPQDRHVGLVLAAHTGTADLISFLRHSPVQKQLPWLAEWEGAGEFDLSLVGRIALDDNLHDFTVESTHRNTGLSNARLHVRLEKLAGPLRYRYPADVTSRGMLGALHGRPVRFGIVSATAPAAGIGAPAAGMNETAAAGEIRFKAEGAGDGAWLQNWLPWPVAKAATGSFAWNADMRISTAGKEQNTTLVMNSDFAGFGLLLPAPLAKLGAARRPGRFQLRSSTQGVQLAYDDQVLQFRGDLRDGELVRGSVGFGRTPDPVPSAGLLVVGAPRELDVLAWAGLIAASQTGGGLSVRADLAPARVLLGDLDLPDAKLSVRSVGGRYRVDFDQRDFAGALELYQDQRPMHLALRRVRLPRDLEIAHAAPSSFLVRQTTQAIADPLVQWRIKDFPPMSVDVTALYYGDELLGHARFDLQPVADGIELRGATGVLRGLTFDDARLTWRRDGRGDSTRFFGLLRAANIAPVLGSFGYAGSVESKQLSLRADLGWVGSPLAFKLSELDGSAELELSDGRFVQVQGAGAARLLGVFDFAAIARRARLDFTDVFGKGLAYDKISGRMQFAAGQLSFPETLQIEGPGSEFRLGGSVNLASGGLSNDMIVTLPLSRTLPWYAAYAAFANPLAGAGLFVAERLLRDQINQFSSAKYHISGTIDEPLVNFVSVFDRTLDQTPPGKKLSHEPQSADGPSPRVPGGARAPSGAQVPEPFQGWAALDKGNSK